MKIREEIDKILLVFYGSVWVESEYGQVNKETLPKANIALLSLFEKTIKELVGEEYNKTNFPDNSDDWICGNMDGRNDMRQEILDKWEKMKNES